MPEGPAERGVEANARASPNAERSSRGEHWTAPSPAAASNR
jgi:hypothetical protein